MSRHLLYILPQLENKNHLIDQGEVKQHGWDRHRVCSKPQFFLHLSWYQTTGFTNWPVIDCLRERGREKDYLWHGHYAKGTQTLYLDHNSWEDRLRAKKKLSLSPNSVTEAPQIVHSKLSRRDWLVKLCEGKQIKINGQHRPGKDSPPTYTEHILFLLVMNEQINWPWH